MKKINNFLTLKHKMIKRNYLERMNNNKVKCMKIAKKYDFDYWDGNRKYGYGGYRYIKGYHTDLAKKIIKRYHLNNKSKVLDIGCGKAFLTYEIKKITKSNYVYGIDISKYAKQNSIKEFKKNFIIHDIKKKLNFKKKYFDLVLSTNVLHNLKLKDIKYSIQEMNRVGKKQFICVESYRNEKEQFNLQCWALTAETILDTKSWEWILKLCNFKGDYEFIFFE